MEKPAIVEAENYLRTRLASGPQLVRDLQVERQINPRTLRRAAQNLGITRSRRGENGPWVWALPKNLPPPVPEYLFTPPATEPTQASVADRGGHPLYYWVSLNRDTANLSQRPLPTTVRCVPTPQRLLGFADAGTAARVQRAWVLSRPEEREEELAELLPHDVVVIQPDNPQRPSIFTHWFPE